MSPLLAWAHSNRSPDFVLDVAVVAAWLLPRRASQYTSDVQWHLVRKAVAVPSLWLPQLAEVLLAAERKGETTSSRITSFLTTLSTLPIFIDDETEFRAWNDTLDLARTHSLSISDAAYLELALRLSLPLATSNATLRRAAIVTRVPIFTP